MGRGYFVDTIKELQRRYVQSASNQDKKQCVRALGVYFDPLEDCFLAPNVDVFLEMRGETILFDMGEGLDDGRLVANRSGILRLISRVVKKLLRFPSNCAQS